MCLAALAVPSIARAQDPVHWTLTRPAKANVDPGKEFDVVITAQIDMGWHLYSLTQPQSPTGLSPVPTTIILPAK